MSMYETIMRIKGILHLAEFPLYARRFLNDIVATSLTR